MNLNINWYKILLFLLLIPGLLFLFVISLSIKIDYWDGFAQLANARAIYTQQKSFFFVFRPLFISLINLPIISLKDLGVSFFTILGLSHLLSFLIGVLLLLTTYLFLRDSFTPGIALLTTVLFSLNRLFIHYIPFTMTDIPASLFFLLSIFIYVKLRKRRSLSLYAWFVISVTLALLTRLNMILLLPVIFLSEVILSFRERGSISGVIKDRSFWRIPFLLAISCWFFIAIHFGVLVCLLKGSFVESLKVLGHNYLPSLTHIPINFSENLKVGLLKSCQEYFFTLIKSSGPGFLMISGLGCAIGLIKKRDRDVICLIWFLFSFFSMTFLLRHKEVRYIIPFLFPLYYFCASLFDLVLKKVVSWVRYKKVVLVPMSFLVLIPQISNGLNEYLHFLDPVYYTSFGKEVIRIVQSASSRGNAVYCWGEWFSLFPKKRTFAEIDVNFCKYDVNPPVIHLLSGVRHYLVSKDYSPFLEESSPLSHLFLRSGDICLLFLEHKLVVLRIKRIELIPEEIEGFGHFEDEERGILLTLQQKGENLLLKPLEDGIRAIELHLIKDDGRISGGLIKLDRRGIIFAKQIFFKGTKKAVLIIPLIEMVIFSDGEIRYNSLEG
ncbi:TPA: hypothetical protein DCX15_04735 [bacterium]|nr:hypothetical protein [bacterium]